MKEQLKSLDFDQRKFGVEQLMHFAVEILFETGVALDRHSLYDFVEDVRLRYNGIPFHNFRHAFDVLQATNSLIKLTQESSSKILTPFDIFTIYVAALCHDLEHIGVTNHGFRLLQTTIEITGCLLGTSSNEFMHLASFKKLVKKHSSPGKLFSDMDINDVTILVESVQFMILFTDIEPEMVGSFKREPLVEIELESNLSISSTEELSKCEDYVHFKRLVMSSILRTADISHVIRSFCIHSWWTDKYTLETTAVNEVVALNSSKKKQVKANPSTEEQLKSSIFFIENIAQPTFDSFCTCFPEAQSILTSSSRNLSIWKSIADTR